MADGAALAEEGLRLLRNEALCQEIKIHTLDLDRDSWANQGRFHAAIAEAVRQPDLG